MTFDSAMSSEAPSAHGLSGVPLTLLWTLHNRASEACRADARLHDPDAVRIRDALPFDYVGHFGAADGSHALRSAVFDAAVREWLDRHRGGQVVELACGLETQVRRCDDGQVRWLAIDLPEVIALRERFLPPDARRRHLACSATDLRWMDAVDATAPVFITAQGLLMYLPPNEVSALLAAIDARFPRYVLMFDAIPRWFSRKTLRGFALTSRYVVPPMPWGINGPETEPFLTRVMPRSGGVVFHAFGPMRGARGRLLALMQRVPWIADRLPQIVQTGALGWRGGWQIP